MSLWNTIEFARMTLGLVPETLDTIDVIVAVGKQLGIVNPEVMKARHIQHVIVPPTVRIDDAVGQRGIEGIKPIQKLRNVV